jgi:hypothetical protein
MNLPQLEVFNAATNVCIRILGTLTGKQFTPISAIGGWDEKPGSSAGSEVQGRVALMLIQCRARLLDIDRHLHRYSGGVALPKQQDGGESCYDQDRAQK